MNASLAEMIYRQRHPAEKVGKAVAQMLHVGAGQQTSTFSLADLDPPVHLVRGQREVAFEVDGQFR